jgi:hypothetical protein
MALRETDAGGGAGTTARHDGRRRPGRQVLDNARVWTPSARRVGTHVACFALWCAVAVAMLPELAVRHTATFLADYDNSVQSFAWMSKLSRAWRAGEVPLWDFETASGQSFIGELQTAPLYPPHIAFALSGLPLDEVWLDRYMVLHFAVGAFLMYWMLRGQGMARSAAAVGAMLFVFVGTVGQKAGGQMNIFCAMVWLPGAFGCAMRGLSHGLAGPWSMASAGFLALSVLAGHPAPFSYAVIALAVAVVFRVVDVPVGTASVRAAAIVAIALLLAAPQLLPTIEYMRRAYRWVGIDHPILALARVPYEVFARGEILHLGELRTALQPSWGTADGATLFVTLTGLALAVIGATRRDRRARFALVLAALSVVVALGEEGHLARLFYSVPLIGNIREPIRMLFLYQFAMAILAALGVDRLAALPYPRGLWRLAGPLALAAVVTEERIHVDRLYHDAASPERPSLVYRERPAVTWLRARLEAEGRGYRFINHEDALPENFGDVLPGLRSTSGHRATMPRAYFDLLETDWSLAAPHWDLLAARYVVSAAPLAELGEPVAREPFIYVRSSALPVFQVVASDGSRRGVVPRNIHWSTNSVELELPGPVQGLLVFAQPSYPGWHATADGVSYPLSAVGPFSGIALSGHERIVRFAYRPASIVLGLLAMGLALGLWPWVHRRFGDTPEPAALARVAKDPPLPVSPAAPTPPPAASAAARERWLRPLKSWEVAGVLAVLGAFVGVAVFRAWQPGLYYDELAFVNAARGGPSDIFIESRLLGVPVLLMPYLGALKSLIYFPIFQLFGVTEVSVRFPTVALTVLTLLLFWLTLRRLTGPAWGLVGLLLMGLDPALVYHVRYDWGPVCLMLLLEAVLLWSTLQWLRTGRRRFAAVALVAIVLGTYDKLNFLWISNALAVAVAVVYRAQLRERWRADRRAVVACGAALAVFSVGVVAFRVVPFGMGDEPFPATLTALGERIASLAGVMDTALGGIAVFEFIFEVPMEPRVPIEAVAAAALALVLLLWPRWPDHLGPLARFAALCAAMWMLVFVQLVLTPAAGGSHHFMTLWAFPWLGLASALALLTRWPRRTRGRQAARAVGATLVGALVLVQLRVHHGYAVALEQPYRGKAAWSPSIDALARAVPRLAPDTEIHCMDWGLCTQILGLGPADLASRLSDDWPAYADMTPARVKPFFDERVRGRRIAFVTFARGREVFAGSRQTFDALEALDPTSFSTVSFGDGGPPVVELHVHEPR